MSRVDIFGGRLPPAGVDGEAVFAGSSSESHGLAAELIRGRQGLSGSTRSGELQESRVPQWMLP